MAASSSVFAKALAGGRGSAAKGPGAAAKSKAISAGPLKAKAAPGPTRQLSAKAKASAGNSRPSTANSEGGQDGGTVTCANRNLLQQMLAAEGVAGDGSDDDCEEADDDEGGEGLNMSYRHINVNGGVKANGAAPFSRNVPTISSPPARPVSRGGVPTISSSGVGAQVRPVSRGGSNPYQAAAPGSLQTRGRTGPPGATVHVVQQVTTGPPTLAGAMSYVSAPRPGSRGAGGGGVPPAVTSVPQSPAQVRRVAVPTGAAAAAGRVVSGYANVHAVRAKQQPPSPAAKPAAKPAARPLCGPSAFAMLSRLEQERKEAALVSDATPRPSGIADDGDEGGFVMPDSDPESDASDSLSRPVAATKASEATRPPQLGVGSGWQAPIAAAQRAQAEAGESAADYVERLKRGLAAGREAQPSEEPSPMASPASVIGHAARARSSDARQETAGAIPQPAPPTLVRSRSSDPRAAVAAARAASPPDSDDDDDCDDDDDRGVGRGIQWKADVRSLVRNFAQEERNKVRPNGSGAQGAGPRKPPRAPPEALARKVAEEEAVAVQKPKQPRLPVEYTPATMEDYKQRYGEKGAAQELGRLGPDLDDEGVMMKRAVQEKVKQFSKELKRINTQRSTAVVPKPPPKPEPKVNSRAKALEFAQNIPRPKLKPNQAKAAPAVPDASKDADREKDIADWEEIRRRIKQHDEDVAKVAEVKEFLNRLPF